MSEKLVLLDKNANITQYYVDRDYAHTHGILHPTVHIWVVKKDPMRILIQQRSFNKDSFPGQWDMSSAGHVTYQDTMENAALRELEEELGIHTDIDHLIPIGCFSHHTIGVFHNRPWNDNEFSKVFLCVVSEDFQPTVFLLVIESVRWITPEELKEMQSVSEQVEDSKKLCVLAKDVEILFEYLEGQHF